MRNKITELLPFKSPLQPYGTYFALSIMLIATLTNGFWCFFPGEFNATSFLTSYISIPIFLAFYFGHKLFANRRGPWIKDISSLDVFSGLEEVAEVTENDVPPVPKNLLQKLWFWIC